MITITLNNVGQTIKVPQSWAEIKLKNYEKWFDKKFSSRTEQVNYIADVCNIHPSVLLESPAQLFDIVFDAVCFVFEENIYQPQNSIKIDNVVYSITSGDELSLAEWVDIESVFTGGNQSQLSEILSILCRPQGEKYDSNCCEVRQQLFADLTMDKAMPLLAFFLLQSKRSETISNLCSQIKTHADQYLRLTRDFVENGAGTKSLPIWQKIKFYFLIKYLQNRLSKFSDSCSIVSTKSVQKKNNINFKRQ